MYLSYLTSNTLIEAVKRKANIPTNQSTFKAVDFLAFATEELLIGLVPSILQLHEEFYVFVETVPLVTGKNNYGIPYRAIGGKIRDVFYQDESGTLFEMAKINPEDKAVFQNGTGNSNQYLFYYLQSNDLVIASDMGGAVTGSLVFTYFIRPSGLVEESRVGIITDIASDSTSTTYTLDKIPTGFSSTMLFDLLQAKPGHKIRRIDLSSTTVNAVNKTITFLTSDIDDETETGDMIAFAGECIIPQCPSDLHPVLAQRVAARCLEALGDTQGLTNANSKLQEMELKTVPLIDSRVDGRANKLVNRNGLIRNTRNGIRRW